MNTLNNTIDILEKAKKLGIQIFVEKGTLKLKKTKGQELPKDIIAQIKENKSKIIQFLEEHQTSNDLTTDREILKAGGSKDGSFPMSFNQERLWFVDQLQGSIHYHMPYVFSIYGKIDTFKLEMSFKDLINRHEVLRTIFFQENGVGLQKVISGDHWKMTFLELDELLDFEEYLQTAINQPFDLSSDYSLRVHLVTLKGVSKLVIVIHHIAFDGQSLPIFIKQLKDIYTGHVFEEPTTSSEHLIQYKDFSVWQRSYFNGNTLDKKLDYWEQRLEDLSTLDLPINGVRPSIQSSKGNTKHINIDKRITDILKVVSNQERVTMHTLMLGIFKILMFKYSGQKDICIGSPFANRSHTQIHDLIGFFTNALPIRTQINNDASFKDFIKQVRANVLDCMSYQDTPFSKIVSLVDRERDISRTPLFQVLFSYEQKLDFSELKFGESTLSLDKFDHKLCKYDLAMGVEDGFDGMSIRLEYCTDLFSASFIDHMLQHYTQLIVSIVENPDTIVGDLKLLGKNEEENILNHSKVYNADYPKGDTIVSLFNTQVLNNSTNSALTFNNLSLTYEELDQRSNQLAHFLKDHGVKEETLIGLVLDSSLEMIISILAILKAGGAYVPIDPEYPKSRVSYILNDAEVPILLSSGIYKSLFQENANTTCFYIDDLNDTISQYPSTAIKNKLTPANLAYIIYTSGSTGKPKGVAIEHKNVVRLFKTDPNFFDFSSNDVWTLFHSFCFDFSVWEIFGALLFGGRLVIVPKVIARDTASFTKLLEKEQVTVLNQTPTAFNVLQDYLSIEKDYNLQIRYVIFGGEALNPSKLSIWHKLYPTCKLINMYGITETTVHVTFKELSENDFAKSCSVIGKPIPTLSCYVLDENLNLLPNGIPGELYVGGDGVARGYINRPKLTQERFINNPYEEGLLYRTSDIVKRLPNGDMEYLGRKDMQVKIRGYRIELGEIENTLINYAGVSQNVVLVKENKNGVKRLVAYITTQETIDKLEIQEYLKTKLPEFMIPHQLIFLDKFPMTINGKIDQKSLLQIDMEEKENSSKKLPKNKVEKIICSIWEDVLGVNDIGISDDFFLIGGDSILLIRVSVLIQKTFNKKIAIAEFYQFPTIEQLARKVKQAPIYNHDIFKKIHSEFKKLKAEILAQIDFSDLVEDIYPMSAIQKGMTYSTMIEKNTGIYHDQTPITIEDSEFDLKLFKKSVGTMVKKHSILRTAFDIASFEKEFIQIIYKSIDFTIEYEDLSIIKDNRSHEYIETFLRQMRKSPFDITKAPLWRISVLKINEKTYTILLECHHSILDGWSVASLFTELLSGYFDSKNDSSFSPHLLKSTYKDYVVQETYYDNQEQYLEQWRSNLSGTKKLNLFTAKDLNDSCYFAYDQEYARKLQDASDRDHLSLRTLFLGAYLYVLRTLVYDNDLTIGLISNNRPAIDDGEKILGCFAYGLPFRSTVASNNSLSWKQYFEEVDQNLSNFRSMKNITFLKIVEELGVEHRNENPFFDVIFNLMDFRVLNELEEKNIVQTSALMENKINHIAHDRSNTYLDFVISVTGGKIMIRAEQKKELNAGLSLEQIVKNVRAVINKYLEDQDATIDSDSLMSPSLKEKLLINFQGATTPYPKNNIVEIFKDIVSKFGNKDALIFEQERISYAELYKRSLKLANCLSSKGITPGERVGILAVRGIDMIVSILGVLHCQGVYVPLHSEYPLERLQYIAEDASIKCIVHTNPDLVSAKNILGYDYININDSENYNSTFSVKKPNSDAIAYLMYTSGTTGVPKGVQVTHKNILKLVYDHGVISVNPEDKVLQWSNFAFDGSTYEIFSSLLKGASLYILKEEQVSDAIKLSEVIASESLTVCFITTALFNSLVDYNVSKLSGLRKLLFGGELVSISHVKTALASLGQEVLVHVYGPTETVVYATSYPINSIKNDIVPIGFPLDNTRIYIVTNDGALCPIGVAGEIWIGGDGVSSGYLNKQDLTNEKFIKNPFDDTANTIVYRTGDIGKWLVDGSIEFIGREDAQVKIRGYRIELGEIESVMQESGMVKQSIVLALSDPGGSRRLVSYVIGKEGFDKKKMKEYLSSKLPDYMIPPFIIPMSNYPLTPNGKIDQKSLPNPLLDITENIESNVPSTKLEKELAILWKEILNLDSIGIHEEFFDLGGHSLLATKLAAKIRSDFEIEIEIKDIFIHDTIAKLGAFISTSKNNILSKIFEMWQDVLGIEHIGIHEEFFDLGGHSLLATKLVAKIRNHFEIEIEIKDVFIHDTIAKLSDFITISQNDILNKIRGIWQDVLEIEDIGIHEEFFDLGGHSLLATKLVSLTRQHFNIDVEIKDLFIHDTVASFSEFIASQQTGQNLSILDVQIRPEHIPLSFAQERLWFIDQLEGSTHYHIPIVLELEGTIDVDVLEMSVNKIINRHETLRTIFYQHNGVSCQQILPENSWKLSTVIERLKEESIQEEIGTLIQTPFDLSKDHLLRIHLIRKSSMCDIMIINFHHITTDGWSFPIFLNELSSFYSNGVFEKETKLPELSIQYSDYAIWQRNYLQGEVLRKKINYWENQLKDSTPLELPTDFIRPAIQSTKGNLITIDIEENLAAQLLEMVQEQGVTLFMLMLSAFKVLLHRYSGQTDISVGSPIANRSQVEIQQLVGFFVNTLVLRSNLNGDPTFKEVLNQVKTTTLSAYEHQDLPFEHIVNHIQQRRDRSRSPFFQVMFTLNSVPDIKKLKLGELQINPQEAYYNNAKYDLTYNITDTLGKIQLSIEYCTDLFLQGTIERMAKNYFELLKSIVKNPKEKISNLSIMDDEDRSILLNTFNKTEIVSDFVSKTLIDIFNESVTLSPNQVALTYGKHTLTYKQLDEESNQLARFLQSQYNIKTENRIAVELERSNWFVISFLAVLKIGAVYVPIDPSFPNERIAYIKNDSDCKAIITDTVLKKYKEEKNNYSSLSIDVNLTENNLAYVIYTSGSTGVPKGVMIEHKGIVNTICSQIKSFEITSTDRCLQFSNQSFDASIWEVLITLLGGAQLFIIEEDVKSNPEYFTSFLKKHKISWVTLPPSFLKQLEINKLTGIKTLITAGEEAPLEEVNAFSKIGHYINAYGPTETSICATTYQGSISSNVPIGYPIANTKVYILDAALKLLPIGAIGELYISGKGLARGYINLEELTKEKFVKNPFEKDERLYKTGDLARWLPDGSISFVGRKDNQVKINGYRVELNEIKSQIEQSNLVEQCALIVKENKYSIKQLIAYVVAKDEFNRTAVINFLKNILPEYMIPKIYVLIDRIPINSSGKIDYKALPEPDEKSFQKEEYVSPSTDTEKQLVHIWQELLGIEKVGVYDNFFELGGNSIASIKMINEIRLSLDISLSVKLIFQYQNIISLSQIIDDMTEEVKEIEGKINLEF